MECLRINLFQRIAAKVIVTVTGRSGKMNIADSRLLHGFDDLQLIVLRCFIDHLKAVMQTLFDLSSVI